MIDLLSELFVIGNNNLTKSRLGYKNKVIKSKTIKTKIADNKKRKTSEKKPKEKDLS